MAVPSETHDGEDGTTDDGQLARAVPGAGRASSQDAALRVDTLLTALALVGPWQLFERTRARLKLSYTDAAIIVALSQAVASPNLIAARTGVEPRSVRRGLARLQQRGIVGPYRARVEHVRRYAPPWKLTDAGADLASELMRQAGDQLRFVLSSMSPAERNALVAAVSHLASILAAYGP
jgi:DNA-binding MarR family transcriptional regulator